VSGRALGRRAFPYLLVSVFGFLLAYVLLFLFAFPAEVLPDDGKVPTVVGISFDDAMARLEKAGFHGVQGETRYHRSVAQGIVLQQDPPAGSTQKRGIDAVGPMSADTLFHSAYHGAYDAVVAMYHDQGLVPLKMIGFETGVNWTLGLPFIRTSPDHGTAYDIAGRGVANPASLLAAIHLAKKLARSRT